MSAPPASWTAEKIDRPGFSHSTNRSNTRLQEGQYEISVPTVADRVAQTVVRMYLEPKVEPIFHTDSYGYRPGKSALDAVGTCRQRCWRSDWVIDLDIQKFFDTVPHDLVERAVAHHIWPHQTRCS